MSQRGVLLSELEWLARNCAGLLGQLKADGLDYKPGGNMGSLGEIARELALIPALDLLVVKGAAEEELDKADKAAQTDSPEALAATISSGSVKLLEYFEKMGYDQFHNESTSAYFGRTRTNEQWLLESVGRLYHFRALLYFAMRLGGYSVSGRDLY